MTGTCAVAGTLLAPLEEAITAKSRDSWHLHAGETSWHVFSPDEGDGPAKWWLWVFIGPDTTCFVMAPTRAGAVLARHAGIDEETGQLADDGDGPRRLVTSSDFCSVCTSAGKKADGLVNLYCWAHIRRYFVRAGDASPAQLTYWTAAWLHRIKALYTAHGKLTAAWDGAAVPAPPRRPRRPPPGWRKPAPPGTARSVRSTRPASSRWPPPACRSPPTRRSPRWTGNGTG